MWDGIGSVRRGQTTTPRAVSGLMMRVVDRSLDRPEQQAVGGDVTVPGDPDLVARLEAQQGQAMFGFVRRLGLTDAQAQDCVQEGLLRLWSELQRGTEVLDPQAWVYRTIYRIAMDEHRLRRRVDGLISILGGRSAPEPFHHDQTDRIAVWGEVDRLPARQRQVLYLRYRADLPYGEIGTVLGMTASAARSHATQAMHTLRVRLDEPSHADVAAGDRP